MKKSEPQSLILCSICQTGKTLGVMSLGGWVCDECWEKIERRPAVTVGKEIAEGLKLMKGAK